MIETVLNLYAFNLGYCERLSAELESGAIYKRPVASLHAESVGAGSEVGHGHPKPPFVVRSRGRAKPFMPHVRRKLERRRCR